MLELLNNGKKYSINELSSVLEVTHRMVRVYKEELEKAGIFIDSIRGPYGGYILNQKVYIKKREENTDKLNLSNHDKNIYNIVSKSLKERKKLKILYTSHEETKERIIHPVDLYIHNNSWYVPAFCEYRNGMRHFEFNKIKEIKLLDEFYE
jgi:predicted DNA-binding transcriptional regulator YafY